MTIGPWKSLLRKLSVTLPHLSYCSLQLKQKKKSNNKTPHYLPFMYMNAAASYYIGLLTIKLIYTFYGMSRLQCMTQITAYFCFIFSKIALFPSLFSIFLLCFVFFFNLEVYYHLIILVRVICLQLEFKVFVIGEAVSPVAQAGLKLTMYLRVSLNF